MEEYKKARFRNHPSIAGTFICFLVRHTARRLELGLKGTIQTLEEGVRRLEKGPKKADLDRLEAKLDKYGSKLDAIIKANNLKTKRLGNERVQLCVREASSLNYSSVGSARQRPNSQKSVNSTNVHRNLQPVVIQPLREMKPNLPVLVIGQQWPS